MKKGDIILVPFPFTDLTDSKIRPALVLIDSEFDVTLAFISTQIHWKEETDIMLEPEISNGLKKESLIRLSKLATIDKDLIFGRLGQITIIELKKVDNNLKIILKIDDSSA